MKLLLVGDNRDLRNWGGRATSIALSKLISTHHTISDRIAYKDIVKNVPVFGHFSKLPGTKLLYKRPEYSNKLFQRYLSKIKPALRLIGIENDYKDSDPQKCLKNLLYYKKYSPFLESIFDKVKACDGVVINGTGRLIFTKPPRKDTLFQLMIFDLATSVFKKPVYYVNSVVSDPPTTERNDMTASRFGQMAEQCSGVALRDPESVRIMKELAPRANIYNIPDALFIWYDKINAIDVNNFPIDGDFIIPFGHNIDDMFGKLDFSKPYICIGGSSVVEWYELDPLKRAYIQLVKKIKSIGLNVYLFISSVNDNFLISVGKATDTPVIPVMTPIVSACAILARSRVTISGRYHPSIMASLGGTPCIFLNAITHKMRSLQEVLNYREIKVYDVRPENHIIDAIHADVCRYLSEGELLRNTIKQTVQQRSNEARSLLSIF